MAPGSGFEPRFRVRAGLCSQLAWSIALVGFAVWSTSLSAATPTLTAHRRLDSPGILVEVRGVPDLPVVLERSSNLFDWEPAATFSEPTGVSSFEDHPTAGSESRFYRARFEEPSPVTAPLDAHPSEIFEIPMLFPPWTSGELLVRFAGMPAEIIGQSLAGVLVRVPADATSGVVTLEGIGGNPVVAGQFVVVAPGPVLFVPPVGIAAESFRLVNAYGAIPGAATRMTVRRDRPLLNLALPLNPTRKILFLGISVSDRVTNRIDAASTATALVFLSPLLNTPDPDRARTILDWASSDPKVQALATALEASARLDQDIFTNTNVVEAYHEAILAVHGRAASAHRPESHRHARPQDAAQPSRDVSQVDLDSIEITHSGTSLGIASAAINHLDWVVTIRRVDVAKAFPAGRRDYRALLGTKSGFGASELPLVDEPPRRFLVNASLWLDSADIGSVLGKLAMSSLGISTDVAGRLDLPDDPALYVLRAVSPAWSPSQEASFVQDYYHNAYLAAARINLLAAAVDILSTASPIPFTGTALEQAKDKIENALSGLDTLPPIDSRTEFLARAMDLASSLSTSIGFKALEAASESGAAAAGQAAGTFRGLAGFISKSTRETREKTETWIDIGKAAERALGLVLESPLESAFIEVGDAFQLRILKIEPPEGAVGDKVELWIEGRHFDPSRPSDGVFFANGAAAVPRGDIAVSDVESGNQRIAVKVPVQLAELAAADPAAFLHQSIVVVASGRRGVASFVYHDHPVITRMGPSEGFAAAPNYLGAPFPGTTVELKGFGFSTGDRFSFHQTEATDKSGRQGLVSVRVPSGAVSDRIEVVRTNPVASGPGYSTHFKVLGPPVVVSAGPASGPVGTTVRWTVENLGPGPAMLVLNGAPLSDVRLFNGIIAGVVPFGSVSGRLSVVTPAGTAGMDFTVEAGLANGAIVQVGADSPIPLQRALDLAAHQGDPLWSEGCSVSATCIDDDDVERDPLGNPIRGLDPPAPGEVAEEGDFITDDGPDSVPRFRLGKAFADTIAITGTSKGNVVLGTNNLYETILSGDGLMPVIEGEVHLAGSFNHLVNLLIRGRLVIEGDHNLIEGVSVEGSENDGVTILGHANEVRVQCTSNTYDGLVIDGGSLNKVQVLATANGGNGVTLKGGAFGNQVAVFTGFLPTSGGLVPWRGNGAHGVALVGKANNNLVVGLGAVARNVADGIHLAGPDVRSNLVQILELFANGGNGIVVTDGAAGNSIGPLVAASNDECGAVLRGAPGTRLQGLRVGFNKRHGVLLGGVTNLTGPVTLDSRSNLLAGVRLDSGTHEIELEGASNGDGNGLALAGPETTGNQIRMTIDGSIRDSAVLHAASWNIIHVQIRNGGGTGLLLEAGATGNRFPIVRVNQCAANGIVLRDAGTTANVFPDVQIGLPIQQEAAGNFGDGIVMDAGASQNLFGSAAAGSLLVQDNGGVGIRIRGATTLGNLLHHPQVHEQAGIGQVQKTGILLEGGVSQVLIEGASISGHANAGISIEESPSNDIGALIAGAAANQLSSNVVGIRLAGAATTGNRVASNNLVKNSTGILLESGAVENDIAVGNLIERSGTGVRLDNASRNRVRENTIRGNSGPGIHLANGAKDNLVRSNEITLNAVGILVAGSQSTGNTLTVNRITANAGKGIQLVTGGNREVPAPGITSIGSQRITGTAFVSDGGQVELFKDSSDEGATLIGTASVVRGEWVVQANIRPGDVGNRYQLHATVRDSLNDTSEFGGAESYAPAIPIAFVSDRDGNRELYWFDPATDTARRLTEHPAVDESPTIRPGGGGLVFVSNRDGNRELYRMQFDASPELARLTDDPAADYDPAWSPDGSWIAYVSDTTGNAEIFATRADGSSRKQLTFDAAEDRWPSFSPDGTRLAFASRRSGNWDIWIISADGTDSRLVSAHPANDTRPAWSPDGKHLAFVSDRDGNPEIYVMNSNGTEAHRVTSHPSVDTDPAWLPDSATLLFSSDRDSGFELYSVSMSGGVPERLTVSHGDNVQPTVGR